MMKALVLALTLVGCTDTPDIQPDAGPDASPDARVCSALTTQQSWEAPVGECCDENKAFTCAQGQGVCVVDMCVRQCSGHAPACPNGGTETWRDLGDGTQQCICR